MEKEAASKTSATRTPARAGGRKDTPKVPGTPAKKRSPAAKGERSENTRKGRASKDADARPYHHGNLREDLVRCGKEQLREVGLAELSLRRIASEVGVSQVAPKHHFGNKEGLLAAIAASGFRDLTEFRYSRL